MVLEHDIELDVAVANTRRAKVWKNKKAKWSDLVERMSTTTKTAETVAEYKAMSRDQQAEIKDTGAFVGGYCNNGSRSDIRSRSILALDADFAESGLWEDWAMMGYASAYYTTHKHTPEKPRLRIVIPLSRDVDPDEYQAIGRKIASGLGIDQFDDSTYQPQRCMFWPSTSRDGEFLFGYLDGDILNPDEVLASYKDWRDISAWPVSSRVAELSRKTASKQQDPTQKPGLIGAFCRAYSIEDAISAFVPDYQPCEDANRYTYVNGSTAAGVVTYEGKFSYSFHGTDPASGILCNAWDLVRLHRFGDRDADFDRSKPATQSPSYKAMTEFAANDPEVRSQVVADRLSEAEQDFSAPAETGDWTKQLKVTKDGAVASTIENVVLILRHDPRLAGRLAMDEMTHNIITTAELPCRLDVGQWTDSDDSALRFYLEKAYGLSGKDKIFDAVNVVSGENRFHPVRDYLDGCEWDGTPRIESMLIDYLGAEDTPYTRAVTRKTMIAAVSRIYNPGCKFDYMLVLRGRQGMGKSALIHKIGGRWYSDSFTTMQGKDSFDQLQGAWIIEVGELAGMKKAEAEMVKLFISKQSDRFRPAYGRRTQDFPRQCIFVGTTNETAFLRDATGNRRFWVVDTPNPARLSVWDDLTQDMVSQLWGEAVALYKAGEDLYLPRELEATAREVQAAFEEENPKEGVVAEYLDRKLPEDWYDRDVASRRIWLEGNEEGTVVRTTVSCIEIWAEALGNSPERIDRYAIKELMDIVSHIGGWGRCGNRRTSIQPYGRQRYYKRLPD